MDLFFVYLICFGVGLLFTIICGLGSHVFGGHDADVGADGHGDAGSDAHAGHDMPGLSPLSPTTIATFVTAFGGFGMVFSKFALTQSPLVSIPLSALSGLLIAAGVFWFFRALFGATQSSSEARISDLVGVTATVITPIAQNGVGEIAYVQAGSRYTAPAREQSGLAVGNGESVTITRIVGSQFYVTKT